MSILHSLPEPETDPRAFQPTLDGLPPMLEWLGREGFDGAVTAQTADHRLSLLIIRGVLIGASLLSRQGAPAHGGAALHDFVDRVGTSREIQTRLIAYPRTTVECLASALDPQPAVRSLSGTEALRHTLREVGSAGHHGIVDIRVGQQWGRILFQHGRPIGAYDSTNLAVAPSLASLGKLAAAGSVSITVTIYGVPRGALQRLRWPTAAAPAAVGVETAAGPKDEARDKRIEDNFLWLLSHVEKDWDRAAQGDRHEGKVLQVLAAFTNAMFSFAAHLAPGSHRGSPAPRLAAELPRLRRQHPLAEELELKDDELDAAAVVKRYRSVPNDSTFAAEFYQGVSRALLALTQVAADYVADEISQPVVRQRCEAAMETWLRSQETALTTPRPALAG